MAGNLSENFEIYGGNVALLLNGRANQLGSDFGVGLADTTLVVPPFETVGRHWLSCANRGAGMRRSLPGAGQTGYGMVVFVYLNAMPSTDDTNRPIVFLDAGNAPIMKLCVRPNGNLQLRNSTNTVIGETAAPAISAATVHKIEIQVAMHATIATATVRVDNVAVLTLTGLVMPGTIAQVFTGISDSAFGVSSPQFCKAFAAWTTAGTYNTNFPAITGVQRLTGREDGTPLGWTSRPRQKIGVGVLANLQKSITGVAQPSAVDCTSTTNFNIGSGDYTLESWVRFAELPGGSDAATLFGKWIQATNNRSYRLVKYGPTANLGKLRFEISTDGTLAGVVTVADIVWAPEIGRWYNLAVTRTANVTRLYIDGVQQGANIADANTYFAATAKFVMGNEFTAVNTTIAAGVAFSGHYDEARMTVGVGRYTANYTPTAVAYPRTIGGDASFASVQLLIGCDASFVDESTTATKTIAAVGAGAAREVPNDGTAQYQTINPPGPLDDRFMEASLIAATGVLTYTGQPANTETVVLGAKTYTFNTVLGAANSILIGATVNDSIQNLIDAINLGPGIGTRYGTGTTINLQAAATLAPTALQMTATAYTPGVAGNTIASTETVANASWSAATLLGGLDIPAASQFPLTPLDPRTTGIRWIELVDRSFVSTGAATAKNSLVVSAAVADGATNALSTTPTYRQDIIEEDPNTLAAVTPTTVINGSIRRTRVT